MERCAVFALIAVLLLSCGGGSGGGGSLPPAPSAFRVDGMQPFNGSTGADVDTKILVSFSMPLYIPSISEAEFELREDVSNRRVTGSLDFTSANRVAAFTPATALQKSTKYRLQLPRTVSGLGPVELPEDFLAFFTTGDGTIPGPPPPPPPGFRLRTLGNMMVGRSSHGSTLLADGRVLITAGFASASSITSTAEIFNPSGETFARTGVDMVAGRGFHTATLLSDGRVLIAGGVSGATFSESNSAEIYDPVTDTFAATGAMTDARAFHTATRLGNGYILIAGGTVPQAGGAFSSRKAELYDPVFGQFSPLQDMSVYRAAHTATMLADGRVLLCGGNSSDLRAEIFDPGIGAFTIVSGNMRVARRGHTANLLDDGTVLLTGGGSRTGELFVPAQSLFRLTNGYPLYDRKDHTATEVPGGRIFLTGGSYFQGNVLFFRTATEHYDPGSGAFLGSPLHLVEPRTRHRATPLADGRILITGGENLDPTRPELSSAEIYETD